MPEILATSRTEAVLEEIRRAILARELTPGQPLVEMELAQRLGVSKTPVREALKILSGSGLVTISPYRGASVRIVDRQLTREVCELRLLLEPEALRRAVAAGETRGLDEAAETLAAASALLASGDHAELSLLNRRFHRALCRDCDNSLLVNMLDDLRDRAALVSVAGWRAEPSWTDEWEQHSAVLDAARAGDATGAAELLRRHISGFLDRIMVRMADEGVESDDRVLRERSA